MDPLSTPIELKLPGDSRYMRLARLMASGVASACGLPLEEVEDFRIVVDEICATLIEAGGGEPLRLAFRTRADSIVVEGRTVNAGKGPNQDRLALSHQILDVLTETHEFHDGNGELVFSASTPLRGSGVG